MAGATGTANNLPPGTLGPTGPVGPSASVNNKANPFAAAPGVGRATSGAASHTPRGALIAIGGEFVFVIIATVIANTGPQAGKAMIALFVLLWVLFLINHYS